MSDNTQIQPIRKFRSLTVTLTLAFLALSLFVLIVSQTLGLYFNFKTQETIIRNQQQQIARNAAGAVQDFIEGKYRVLEQAADINALAVSSDRRELVMHKLIGRDPSFRQIALVDVSGTELAKVSRLSEAVTDSISDKEPSIVASVSKGHRYISEIYIDQSSSEPLVLVAIPALDMFREPKAVLIAEVNLKFMWDLVNGISVGKDGVAYVVDRNGDLIAFQDIGRVLAHENVSSLQEVAHFKENHIDTNIHTSEGILGTLSVTGYEALGTPDWAVIVEMPVIEAFAVVIKSFLISLLITALSGILAVLSGLYISKRITRGIVKLNASAEQLSQGKLDTKIELGDENTDNEIGQLAYSFSVMGVKLKALYEGMDEKIMEKTKELSSQVEEVEKSRSAILNLLEDIDTEKRKAEEMVVERTHELSEEKARLLASINSLSFGFVIADTTGAILIKNPALSHILDITDDPKTLADITKHFEGVDLVSSCKECTATNKIVEHGVVSFGKKFLRVFCAPVSEGTNTIGNVVFVEDITEAKVMERSRDEFFAVASHELRTPLTAIRGNADMILEMYADKIVDKDMKEMLTDINSSSVRLINIVNDFLEVSRLEQGKIEIKPERFNPTTVIDKVIRDMKEMIAQKGLALEFAPPTGSIPDVMSDKNRFEQILVNFVGNSTKFTKTGSITISVVPEPNNMLRIRVADTGSGISEHNQALLFRKFQQAGEQMLARDVSQSTGLGLYICKLIISNMGGDIGLEQSELGKGSTFYFTVPVAV